MKKLIIIFPVAIILLIVVAECAVRGLYAYVTWRTEKFPLLYESVYWDVPPWIQYRSILYYDPDIGLIMKPRTTAHGCLHCTATTWGNGLTYRSRNLVGVCLGRTDTTRTRKDTQ